ncbi:MAG: ABC transporter permease [Actinomycetota bacterium]
MKIIPSGDPDLIRIRARESESLRLLDFDRAIIEVGRAFVAFVRYARELWNRRSLVRVLAGRDLKGSYEMNIVGFGWWLLEPLSLTVVYYVLINILQGSATKNDPTRLLSILIAMLPFKWFTSSLIGAMSVVRSNASLVNDIYIPRALLPISQLATGLAHFCVGLIVVPPFMAILGVGPSWALIWLPVVMVVQFVFMLGIAYIFAVWGLNYRNLPGLMGNLLRLWFYLSPALYPLTRLHGFSRTLMQFNPLTGIFQGYRGAILTHQAPDWTLLYTAVLGAIITIFAGWYFSRKEPHFGKML